MIKAWTRRYFKALYQRTMSDAYGHAVEQIGASLESGSKVLDCGAGVGGMCEILHQRIGLDRRNYFGLEWNPLLVEDAIKAGLQVQNADINRTLPCPDGAFRCVFALSVLEHLLHPCRFLRESHRVLENGGTLVLLTPNISTYFTAALILAGKMPSSGPHPDSDVLLKMEEVFKVSSETLQTDADADTPSHRHLIVFSYKVLRGYLEMIGFRDIRGRGFGVYPFPNFTQPILQRIDPWHCHQMVFVARK